MPELPEVETVRRGLEPVMAGARFESVEARRPDLRRPLPTDFAGHLEGRAVTALGRRAKYLLAELDDGQMLVMHLGMSGSFRIVGGPTDRVPGAFHNSSSKNPAHDHVVFRLSTGARVIYNDPRRFGLMTLVPAAGLDAHALFAGLGVEPVGDGLDGGYIAGALRGRRTPLKAALLDQRVVAGLGNIYACEAMHRARLSPRRLAGSVAGRRAGRLADAIRDVIDEAIAAGGASLRDHLRTDGTLGHFQLAFRVYDRDGAPCPTPGCRGTVRRLVQTGRSTFHCPVCQR